MINSIRNFIGRYERDEYRLRAQILQMIGILTFLAAVLPLSAYAYYRCLWTETEGQVTSLERTVQGRLRKGGDNIVWIIRFSYVATDGKVITGNEEINNSQALQIVVGQKIAVYFNPRSPARSTTAANLADYLLISAILAVVGLGGLLIGSTIRLLARCQEPTYFRTCLPLLSAAAARRKLMPLRDRKPL